ncbi:MAG TPA: DUF1571 domain-containing protein [Trinickia sp.]
MTQAASSNRDFVAEAQARFDALENYQVTLRSTSTGASAVEVRYGYRKPGFVRMDFIRPHAGATLVYSPETEQVTLWPFGFDTFPRLTLSPDSRLIRSPSGHRVDGSDIGALLANVRKVQRFGDTHVVGVEAIGIRRAVHVVVGRDVEQGAASVSRYELWFDVDHGMPIKVVSKEASRQPVETVLMDDLSLDVPASQLGRFG